jgi:hypothetical protein
VAARKAVSRTAGRGQLSIFDLLPDDVAGDATHRSVDDLGSEQILSYAEIKALATGSPLVREAAELDTEIARLRRLLAAHQRDQRALVTDIDAARRAIAFYGDQVAQTQRLIEARIDTCGDKFTLTLAAAGPPRRTFTNRTKACPALQAALTRLGGPDVQVGVLAGLGLHATRQDDTWRLHLNGAKTRAVAVRADSDANPSSVMSPWRARPAPWTASSPTCASAAAAPKRPSPTPATGTASLSHMPRACGAWKRAAPTSPPNSKISASPTMRRPDPPPGVTDPSRSRRWQRPYRMRPPSSGSDHRASPRTDR